MYVNLNLGTFRVNFKKCKFSSLCQRASFISYDKVSYAIKVAFDITDRSSLWAPYIDSRFPFLFKLRYRNFHQKVQQKIATNSMKNRILVKTDAMFNR